MVRPRLGLSVALGAILTLLVAGGDSFLGDWLTRRDFRRDSSLVNALFTGPVGQTPWPFGLDSPPIARYFAFGAGLLLVVVVALLMGMIGTRAANAGRGGPAVFLSWWFGVVLGSAVAKVSVLMILQSYLLDRSPSNAALHAYYADGLASATYWGLLVGWLPALFALLGYVVANAKARRALKDELAAAEAEELWPRDNAASERPAPDPGFTYPSGGDFHEEDYDAYGRPSSETRESSQGTAAYATSGASLDRDTHETQLRESPRP